MPSPDLAIADAVVANPQAAAVREAAVWTILCVDDEPNIVAALRRLLRGPGYRVLGAFGGAEALAVLERESVDLVISDMRMPGMDGAQLLARVRERWPHITRVLLTGYADVKSTITAINSGEVYRYITKPWDDREILSTARDAFERVMLEREARRLAALTARQNVELSELNTTLEQQVEARTAELLQVNERIKRNYLTSIKVFSNLIELRGGSLVGHSKRVADLSRRTMRAMVMPESDVQEIFIAGLLHDIGQIGLPDTLLARSLPRASTEETALYRKHPALGEQALMPLDDLQGVAVLIRSHHERHDGSGWPDALAGDAIPLGARILAVADVYDDWQHGHLGASLTAAEARMLIARGRGRQFHPEVVDVFLQVTMQATPAADDLPIPTRTGDLKPGMVLGRELVSREGVMLLASDQVLTTDLIRLIRQHERRDGQAVLLYIRAVRRA